jgi:photosystem II stability/assembly factor-like uncharacterized protein
VRHPHEPGNRDFDERTNHGTQRFGPPEAAHGRASTRRASAFHPEKYSVTMILVATGRHLSVVDPLRGSELRAEGLGEAIPTCLALDPHLDGRAWCGTKSDGVLRSDDGGASWRPCGLDGRYVMSLTASRAADGLVWAGTEPSAVWRSQDGGGSWAPTADLEQLPSSSTWAFPPRPQTHHVRWIGDDPGQPDSLWVAIEAGALVTTDDGGQSWSDRVPDGPHDTHELAVHPDRPEHLHVAAGDGYFLSDDAGASWARPTAGLDVRYLRSVAIAPNDPGVVVVSGASGPRSAYVAGSADGRVFRRDGSGPWLRVRTGWPECPSTIAPLLRSARTDGALWAADERGVHRSEDAGHSFERVVTFSPSRSLLRGFAVG